MFLLYFLLLLRLVTGESAFNYSGYAIYDQLTALKLYDGKTKNSFIMRAALNDVAKEHVACVYRLSIT